MKRIGILTGGGDVPPLNAIISSVRDSASGHGIEAIGFIKGWEGVLSGNYVPLAKIINPGMIGGTILKSSRTNLSRIDGGAVRAVKVLQDLRVEALIVVGGEDTLSNAFLLSDVPCLLISKTIDNDVGTAEGEFLNYFTLGFPTAAEKIVSIVSQKEGLRTTAYSHERIVLVESMGMHAGWLALAAGLGDPDMIIIPEFPLRYEHFLNKAARIFVESKNAVIVVAEGARWSDGSYIHAGTDEGQGFDHPRFGGSAGVLASRMKHDLSEHFDTRNINAVNPSYLYRCGSPNMLDRSMAERLGAEAVRLINDRISSSIFLTVNKEDDGFGIRPVPLSQYRSMDDLHRFVEAGFYDGENYQISENGRRYMKKIIKEMPLDRSYGIGRL
jgi:6-phosphofructokinase